jgi:hypothetical protein
VPLATRRCSSGGFLLLKQPFGLLLREQAPHRRVPPCPFAERNPRQMNLKNPSMAGAIALLACSVFALSGAMVFSSLGNTAQAGVGSGAASAVSAAAMAQKGGDPVVVWMGVSQYQSQTSIYHRLWSDGRLEARRMFWGTGCGDLPVNYCDGGNWREVPPPAGGDGFACRTDINGDRVIDGVDLAEILAAWGNQGGCEPEPTYPCFNLTTPLGLQAMK